MTDNVRDTRVSAFPPLFAAGIWMRATKLAEYWTKTSARAAIFASIVLRRYLRIVVGSQLEFPASRKLQLVPRWSEMNQRCLAKREDRSVLNVRPRREATFLFGHEDELLRHRGSYSRYFPRSGYIRNAAAITPLRKFRPDTRTTTFTRVRFKSPARNLSSSRLPAARGYVSSRMRRGKK